MVYNEVFKELYVLTPQVILYDAIKKEGIYKTVGKL